MSPRLSRDGPFVNKSVSIFAKISPLIGCTKFPHLSQRSLPIYAKAKVRVQGSSQIYGVEGLFSGTCEEIKARAILTGQGTVDTEYISLSETTVGQAVNYHFLIGDIF